MAHCCACFAIWSFKWLPVSQELLLLSKRRLGTEIDTYFENPGFL